MEEKYYYAMIAGALILGGFVGSGIDTEKPVYQCESKNLLANCFKLGANSTRCYYNETTPSKYSYCADRWHNLAAGNINPENLGASGVLIKEFNQCSYICYPEGCLKCQ